MEVFSEHPKDLRELIAATLKELGRPDVVLDTWRELERQYASQVADEPLIVEADDESNNR